MRFLIICPHFAPDVAPTGVLMTAIADELRNNDHEVHVVTSLAWYRHHRVEKDWRGSLIRTSKDTEATWSITRVYPFPTSKTSVVARAAGFVGFTTLAVFAALKPVIKPDGVLVMSPPLTLGLAGWLASRCRRAPLVLNVQDIYPDTAIRLGAIRGRRLIAAFRQLERFLYRCSGAVTVLSDEMRNNISSKVDLSWNTRVCVIPNFVNINQIRPRDRMTRYRVTHGLGDRTVVMYAGNTGYSQPLNLIMDAACAFKHRQDVVFVINGTGSALPALKTAAAELDNVVFVDFQPPESLNEVLASADIHVVALKKGLGHFSVPSKLYSILAAGRPVVASLDADTEVARVLRQSDSGLQTPPEDSEAFTAAIGYLLDDHARCHRMGHNGRSFIESWPSSADVAQSYIDLFAELRED